jgi:hypothetical protein
MDWTQNSAWYPSPRPYFYISLLCSILHNVTINISEKNIPKISKTKKIQNSKFSYFQNVEHLKTRFFTNNIMLDPKIKFPKNIVSVN